jgi:LysR family transcriptional activator of dmlA
MNLPSVDDMAFFDKVSGAASLTEAARDWGVSVAAVSKRLSQLESRLGVQLVTRSTRRLTLTDEGERYAAGAALIVAQTIELEESMVDRRGELRGRIAVHSTLGLGRMHIAPLLAEFVEMHPGVRVELEVSHLPLNLAGTSFDIGIRVGILQDSRLKTRFLARNRRVVCASPDYLVRHGAPLTPADLERHSCIVIRENEGDYALWRFGSGADETFVRVDGNMISNDGEAATEWCIQGRGLIMRSLWHVAPHLESGALEPVLEDYPTPSADIQAVYRSSAQLPLRTSALLDYLRAELPGRLETALR